MVLPSSGWVSSIFGSYSNPLLLQLRVQVVAIPILGKTPEDEAAVREALEASGHAPTGEGPVYVAKEPVPLDDEALEKLGAVLDGMGELDDIEAVFHNGSGTSGG